MAEQYLTIFWETSRTAIIVPLTRHIPQSLRPQSLRESQHASESRVMTFLTLFEVFSNAVIIENMARAVIQ